MRFLGPKILFVDQAGELGGAELSLFDIVSNIGFQLEVVVLGEGPFVSKLNSANVPVRVINMGALQHISRSEGFLTLFKYAVPFTELVRKICSTAKSYDLIYANTQKAFIISVIASIVAQKPLVWHLRDILTAAHFSPAMRFVAVQLSNLRANAVIANSVATMEAYRASGGKAPCEVIYNGIDGAPFNLFAADECTRALRAELKVDNEVKLIGIFGRLAEWKGQHVLVEALKDLPNVHCVIVGGALFGEQEYEKRLKEVVNIFNLSDRCHFLGFRDDVPKLMKGVDFIAHCSIAPEPFGRVVVEAMLAGKPVVATRGGGVDEIVVDGVNGRLSDPGDPAQLKDILQTWINDANSVTGIAQTGFESARERFSLSSCVEKIEKCILSVLGVRAR